MSGSRQLQTVNDAVSNDRRENRSAKHLDTTILWHTTMLPPQEDIRERTLRIFGADQAVRDFVDTSLNLPGLLASPCRWVRKGGKFSEIHATIGFQMF